MKVIVKGSERERLVDCSECDSRLSYLQSDICEKFVEFSKEEKALNFNKDKNGYTKLYIICPECNKEICVGTK